MHVQMYTCTANIYEIYIGTLSIPYKEKSWQEGILITNNLTNKWILAKIKYDHHLADSLYN